MPIKSKISVANADAKKSTKKGSSCYIYSLCDSLLSFQNICLISDYLQAQQEIKYKFRREKSIIFKTVPIMPNTNTPNSKYLITTFSPMASELTKDDDIFYEKHGFFVLRRLTFKWLSLCQFN